MVSSERAYPGFATISSTWTRWLIMAGRSRNCFRSGLLCIINHVFTEMTWTSSRPVGRPAVSRYFRNRSFYMEGQGPNHGPWNPRLSFFGNGNQDGWLHDRFRVTPLKGWDTWAPSESLRNTGQTMLVDLIGLELALLVCTNSMKKPKEQT